MNKPILEAMGKWLTPELSQALEGGVIVEAKLNKAAAALYIKARFSAPLKEGIIAQTKAHLIERLNLSRVEIEFMVPKKEDEKSVLTENTQNPRVCLGKQICTPPMPISQLKKTGKRVVLCGEIFKLESRVTKKGKNKIISFNITDYTDSVPVRIFKTLKQCEKFEGFLKNGEWVILGGSYEFVEFLNQNVFVPEDITVVDRVAPPDTAPEKRVELHMHTNYSAMDGMTTATRLIERAALWGHKAVGITDHGVVQAFPEAASAGKKHGVKILYGCEGYYVDDRDFVDESGEKCKVDVKKARSNHIIIYARNKTGLKNLYKLISNSNVKYFYRRPRMPRSEIESLREGLILGTACEAGELYQGILAGKSHEELLKIASFYDYIEIMPTALNAFLTRPHAPSKKKVRKAEAHDFTFDTMNNGDEQEDTTIQLDENGMLPPRVDGQEGLREINRTLAKIARDLDKPLIATGDVHFLEEKDAIYREILQVGQSYDDAGDGAPLYLRSTQEMLDEFAYLGEETAYEAVVKNPQAIADMCEELIPIPKGSFPPEIEGAKEELRESCYKKARSLYGDPLPEIVATRLERELVPIIDNGFAVMYVSSQKLVEYSNSLGYEVGSRGSVGSSVVASFAGISEVNPLPPHYLCGKCRYSEFIQDGTVESGFDLPRKSCPKCGADLGRDGHDIPFETFLGFKAEKQPDIDLNFSGDIQNDVHTYTEQIFGKENCFKAGTIQQLQDKTAFGFAKKYLDRKVQARALEQGFSGTTQELWAIKDNTTRPAEVMRLANGCVGVKRTTGQHPGGMVVVPSNMEIEDFSPVQYPADKTERDMTTTQFDFKSMLHDTLLKLDILGHDVPTMYKHLEDLTGIPVTKADVTDPRLYELFQSPEPLGISAEELGVPTGTLSIPEMGTRNTIQMLVDAKPKTFADLLQISGLSHGTDVWHGNAKELIVSGECTISDVIGLRDNIMLTLMHKGMDSGMAFQITEIVRKGTAKYKLTREHIDAMNALDLPHWYVDSCMKIKYMFPKAHAAAYVLGAMRLAWYKLYHPTEYYAVFLTVKGGALEAGTILKGQKAVARRVRELAALLLQKNASPKEIVSHDILEIVNEMLLRGIALLPVSLYYSTANVYTIEDGKIRLPFSALGGIGDKAAVDCAEARNKVKGKFNSIEDFQHISEVSSTVMDALREAGCFAGMDEAAQLSLF